MCRMEDRDLSWRASYDERREGRREREGSLVSLYFDVRLYFDVKISSLSKRFDHSYDRSFPLSKDHTYSLAHFHHAAFANTPNESAHM